MFKQAIVRTPAATLVNGLTSAIELGQPDYPNALKQHQNYISVLTNCGVEVTTLPALDDFPDSCFIEDPALLTEKIAVLTRPGAPSRQGEVALIEPTIRAFYGNNIKRITAPGTLEAGDVMRIDNHFYIGLSKRTNATGAEQLNAFLSEHGYTSSVVVLKEVLHLKTGINYLTNGWVLVSGEFIHHQEFEHLQQIIIDEHEAYAANCIMVNDRVLMPAGFPETEKKIKQNGFKIITIDSSEFRKIDGGLSCLSLRF